MNDAFTFAIVIQPDMDKREFKHEVYTELAAMVKALANPARLEIVDLLAQGSRTVEEIAAQTHQSVANASQHLQVMKNASLVRVQRQGRYVHYDLAEERVYTAWQALRELGLARLTRIDRTVRDFQAPLGGIESLTIDQLLEKLNAGPLTILDVRPEKEFRAGHLPGALSIPGEDLAGRVLELPTDREVVAYCRGPFCVFADEAVAWLRERGYRASRLTDGFPDWKARQLPYEVA